MFKVFKSSSTSGVSDVLMSVKRGERRGFLGARLRVEASAEVAPSPSRRKAKAILRNEASSSEEVESVTRDETLGPKGITLHSTARAIFITGKKKRVSERSLPNFAFL